MAAPMGFIGSLNMYDRAREPFNFYIERMEMFFRVNNIIETEGADENVQAQNKVICEWKKAIFLTEIGPDVYGTLTNLLTPGKAKDVSFEDIVEKLEDHFDPKPVEIAESCKFGTRNQKQSETISEYIVALKNLSLHCNFGTFLDRALRDKFMCGLVNECTQSKLLNTRT